VKIQEVGSGEPVLFVHGTGGYGPYWAPLVAELKGYRCLMLDRPGWGGSDPVDYSRVGYRDLVADLMVDVLDKFGVDNAHLVGASIGDTWALALASKYPGRVRSVALLGGGPLTHDVKIPPGIRLLRSPLGRLMSRVRWREKMETGQARGSGHGPSLDDGRMPAIYIEWKVDMTNNSDWRVNERQMVRAITGRTGWKPGLTFDADDLSSVKVPLLMVFGTADRVATVDIWQSFVAQIPSGRLDVIGGAGHLPWFDNPDHVSKLLKDHFQTALA
jgi:pimeloyl-ACP methyl ester carboxylesterase